MKINEAIKQREFRTNHEKSLINILYTYNWIKEGHAEIFKSYKIRSQHFNVLRIVKGKDPKTVSPGYINDVMLDKKRDLTRLVDKLVKLGYLDRKANLVNRRMVDINITEDGKKIVQEISAKLDDWLMKNVNISAEEADQLSDLLDKFRS